MDKRESNYEIMKRQMQAKFASFNLYHVASEWELEQEGRYLLVTFAGRQYKIDRTTGAVFYEQEGILQEADFNVSMTLFDILTRERQHASGTLMSVSSFSTLLSSAAASGGLFNRTAQRFDHHDAELSAACERLGGIPYGKGDVGYLIPVFQDLQTAIQFWDSDEEFPPTLNLFCDSSTGLRVSELCALSKDTFLLDNSGLRLLVNGKGRKERIIQITTLELLQLVQTYYEAFSAEIQEQGAILFNRWGHSLSPQSVRRIINKYLSQIGTISHIAPHMFRHTFATSLLDAGMDIRYIQSLLGHSFISTTPIYTHVTARQQTLLLAEKHPRGKMIFSL